MLWFNHHYRRVADTTIKDEAKKLFRVIAKQSNTSVRRLGVYHFYQKAFYEEKMVETFNQRYEAAVATAEASGGKKPSQLRIRHEVVKEFWAKETPEERERIEKQAEEDYERRLAEGDLTPPVKPEEYERFVITRPIVLDTYTLVVSSKTLPPSLAR